MGANTDAAFIAEALLEGAEGVGLVLRTQQPSKDACPGATLGHKTSHEAALPYALAAMMIVRTPYTYFATSTGWHDEYDAAARCGAPVAEAERVSIYSWTRRYEHC